MFVPALAVSVGCGGDAPSPPPAPPPSSEGSDDRPPNVLLVVLDDVGVDQIAPYGLHPDPVPLPTIESLAAQGMLFERAWAHPWCSPGRAALLTGRHVRRSGMGEVAHFWQTDHSLPRSEVTIAEVLRDAPVPYATIATGKWHMAAHDTDDFLADPLAQGFDTFSGTVENLGLRLLEGLPEGNFFDWDRNQDGTVDRVQAYAPEVTVDDTLARIADVRPPWFAYVALHSAHGPYHVPPDGTYTLPIPDPADTRALYRAELQAADQVLARLLDGLGEDVLAETLVVLTADNGSPDDAITEPLNPRHGKGKLYEIGVRVPLILAGPTVAVPGSRSPALVQLIDLLPTFAEIAGVDPGTLPDEDGAPVTVDGRSLLPLLAEPGAASSRDLVLLERFAPNGPGPYTEDFRAGTDGEYKLTLDMIREDALLFRLDPGSLDDGPDLLGDGVTAEEAAIARDLGRRMDEAWDAMAYEGQ